MKNDKSECDFTDIVYKKVLKLKILHPTFVDMAFNNKPFVTLLRKKFDNCCNDFKLLFHKLSENKIPFFTEDMKKMFYDAFSNYGGEVINLFSKMI